MQLTKRKYERTPWSSFAVSLFLLIILFFSALFTGIYYNNYRAIDDELEGRARSLFHSIVLVRTWSSRYNGVFVEKTAGMKSNPFLKDPDIMDSNGTVYTKKNPALITREISEIAEKENDFKFHITSLNPVNPNNKPDDFEKEALESFVQGESAERFAKEEKDDSVFFRYMAPLYTEKSCQQCHPDYNVGDVRGGISVIFNIDQVQDAMQANKALVLCSFVVTVLSFSIIVLRLVLSLKTKLAVVEEKLLLLATTDELTGLKNRRYILERFSVEFERAKRTQRSISCMLFDLDHFKQINDTFGHDAGDITLKEVSAAANSYCRQTDVLARYGGEEFMLLMPESDSDNAAYVGERIREAIENLTINTGDGKQIAVTASFGISSIVPSSEKNEKPGAEALIVNADQALYRAKGKGRNRVEIDSS